MDIKTLEVEGFHLSYYSLERFDCVCIDSILTPQMTGGSYYPVNESPIRDISQNLHKYKTLFDYVANLKVLNYLEDCSRMDSTAHRENFGLLCCLGRNSFCGAASSLSWDQFQNFERFSS